MFVGRLPINQLFVNSAHHRVPEELLPLFKSDWPNLATRWHYESTFDDGGLALGIQQRNQSFAHSKLSQHRHRINFWIGSERFGRHFDRLLVTRGECPQRMLDSVPELAEHVVRNVARILGYKINAHAFGPD